MIICLYPFSRKLHCYALQIFDIYLVIEKQVFGSISKQISNNKEEDYATEEETKEQKEIANNQVQMFKKLQNKNVFERNKGISWQQKQHPNTL